MENETFWIKEMKVPRKNPIFSEQNHQWSIIWRIILIIPIIIGIYIFTNLQIPFGGDIEPFFMPTPESTRTSTSYILESQEHLMAGNLPNSITALEGALINDPDNVQVLIELARIQTYYSAILTSVDSVPILKEALINIERAVVLDESNSSAFAVYAFVLDWNASVAESVEERMALLARADIKAQQAIFLDVDNVLANVYRAEVLADQSNLTQAFKLIETALEANPNLMDVHRVYALVYENMGNSYSQAIEEYKLAAEIMPNFTYLYIKIGQNYRQLKLYNQALDYFDKAATINEVLSLTDPLPYVAIAKTYVRQGEFFIAARNMQKAVDFDPTNPQLYGELGVIYFQSRNYEGSIPILKCAVEGCLAEENEEQELPVEGLELKNSTVVYYYTYGSVLAALDQCEKAIEILNKVGKGFPEDTIIMDIVQDGLFICR